MHTIDSNLMCKSITKLPTNNCVLSSHTIDPANICCSNNIKLCSETIFKTDNFEEIWHAINNFYGDIVKAEWVSSTELTPTRDRN